MSDGILQVSIEIQGDDVGNALERLRVGLKSTDLMDSIGLQVATWGRKRIKSRKGIAPDGSKWPSLAASTLRRKAKAGKGHKGILEFEGDLADSIVHDNATEDSVDVGPRMPYALIHQTGGTIKRKLKPPKARKAKGLRVRLGPRTVEINMPARPYIGVSREEEDQLRRFVERWVEKLLAKG